jgi:hypothetical protein
MWRNRLERRAIAGAWVPSIRWERVADKMPCVRGEMTSRRDVPCWLNGDGQ